MAVPPWLLGTHLTAVQVTALTKAADGTLAVDASNNYALAGSINSIKLRSLTDHDDIRPLNRRQKNMVITGDGVALHLSEILKSDETVIKNVLPRVAYLSDYIRVAFTRGPNTWTADFTRGPVEDGVTDRGKNTAELDLVPCDNGGAQMTYSTP